MLGILNNLDCDGLRLLSLFFILAKKISLSHGLLGSWEQGSHNNQQRSLRHQRIRPINDKVSTVTHTAGVCV
jgi:hypothetical protein